MTTSVRPNQPLTWAVGVMGDPWSFLILRECFFGHRRFGVIQRHLGVARATLTSRLRHLVSQGILERHEYQKRPLRFEYRLSEKGLDLYPSIVALMQWGDRWLSPKGAPLLLFHKKCGNRLQPAAICPHCENAIEPEQVAYTVAATPLASNGKPVRLRRASNSADYTRGRTCSVARALKVVGDRWAFLILVEAFLGIHRFEDLRTALGIASNVLADRLQRLVGDGVLQQRLYHHGPDRFEYVLTDKGRELYVSCLLLMCWGNKWLSDSKRELILRHKPCGRTFTPRYVCHGCGDDIRAREVTYRNGPIAEARFSVNDGLAAKPLTIKPGHRRVEGAEPVKTRVTKARAR